MQPPLARRSLGAALVVAILLVFWLGANYGWSDSTFSKDNVGSNAHNRPVAKVSMLYGKPNVLYERALRSHLRHARRWGYPMQVLQQEILAGFWNKPSYLLAVIIQELSKPPSRRVEWLMYDGSPPAAAETMLNCGRWVDADSIILNPAIPAGIFLPPWDLEEIHMVASKDHNGLNTGILFLHVHAWTVSLLVETLAHPLSQPEVDLGRSADQEAMARLLQKTTGGPDGHGYKNGLVYLPRLWINPYERLDAYEGAKGDMLVHFPGLEDARWDHMARWLDTIETTPGEWEIPLEQTDYPNRTTTFWTQFRAARDEVNRIRKQLQSAAAASLHGTVPATARGAAVSRLENALEENADDLDLVRQRLDELHTVVDAESDAVFDSVSDMVEEMNAPFQCEVIRFSVSIIRRC
jgi:hypothetical protein